jgi:hypothetical protein
MQVCPNCAKEHDDLDIICVYCGHVDAPDKLVELPPFESSLAEPPPFESSLAEPPPFESPIVSAPATATAPSGPPQPRNSARYGLYGGIAVGVVALAAVPFIMRSGRNEAAPAAATSAARVPAPVPSTESTAEPKWRRTRQSAWASDGSRTMGFELDAERSVPVYLDHVRPVLAVRCISRSVEVFVMIQTSASIERTETHSVKVSLDGEPAVDQQWLDSVDRHSLFAPDGKALAARMAASRSMRFSFKPFNAAPATVEFDVHGFDEPLAAMSKMCTPGPSRRPVPRG